MAWPLSQNRSWNIYKYLYKIQNITISEYLILSMNNLLMSLEWLVLSEYTKLLDGNQIYPEGSVTTLEPYDV